MFASEERPPITTPRAPEVPQARRFPLIATVAPIVASAVLFAVTRSAFTLVFAMLGPVVAVATTADSALHRRRARRSEAARFESELRLAFGQVDRGHAAERAQLDRRFPGASRLVSSQDAAAANWRDDSNRLTTIRLGLGELPSALRLASPFAAASESDAQLRELRERADVLVGGPITVDAAGGIGFVGPAILASAAARSSLLQLAARLSPNAVRITAPTGADWDWLGELPHSLDRADLAGVVRITGEKLSLSIAIAAAAGGLPRGLAIVVELRGDGTAITEATEFHSDFIAAEPARVAARALSGAAGGSGMTRAAALPAEVNFAELVQDEAAGRLPARIGLGEDGPFAIDLSSDGPHAIVGGTTGSGKSELLVSWVLAMAAERSPSDVTFLFVDFKGGAAFDPLLGLPHCVGVITDLDAEQSLRALASLGAELRHRERALASLGLRSIDDGDGAPPFPRLVVVVDEYAALVETHSSLHAVFADIAARGRSLGVHLVLCTQRPAGVVRDGILANCALRISLRVMAAADSAAVLGTDAASVLPARPRGRALIGIAGGVPRMVQVARSRASDGDRIIERWSDAERPRAPWLPPLPPHIAPDVAQRAQSADAIPFGLEDVPELQAQEPARYLPGEHGSLLVVGAARSGKSGVLAALASTSGDWDVRPLPRELPQLWDTLHAVRDEPAAPQRILLIDDLDAIVAACDESYRATLVDLVSGLLRDAPGIHLVLTVQRIAGSLQSVVGLCGSLLVLRMPNRQEHVLAGGAASEFSENMPAGSGHWRGHRVQVFETGIGVPPSPPAQAITLELATAPLVVVSTRPERFAASLRAMAPTRHVLVLGPARFDPRDTAAGAHDLNVRPGGAPDILVADPEAWQGQWSLLGSLQRSSELLFDGCSLAELRTIGRSRELPPPFARGERALWLLRGGEFVRARLPAPMPQPRLGGEH